jgi:hypothetical protein
VKIELRFKTTAIVDDALNEYRLELQKANITPDEFEEICGEFIGSGEDVTIIIDTDTRTASVDPIYIRG